MGLVVGKIALLGTGHIGGSLALALVGAGAVDEVAGWDVDADALARARTRGVCSAAASVEEAVRGAALVVLAAPPRALVPLARAVAAVGGDAVVTDVGSVKEAVVAGAEEVLGGRFVGGHPLAGTERAGPDAADPDLFVGRKVFLTPTERTAPSALELVSRMWQAAGAQVLERAPRAHDELMARVSHLPHVAAYTLAAVVGGDPALAGLVGGGYADTTRVASTPPRMWVDIFLENRAALLPLVDLFVERLAVLRRLIETGDEAALAELIAAARAARERLLGRPS